MEHFNVEMLVKSILAEASPDRLRYCTVPEADEGKYDMSKETMCAIMAMLERRGLLHVVNTTATAVTIAFLTDQMESLPKLCRVVASILKIGTRSNGQWTFSPCEVANDSGEDLMAVYRQLRMYKSKRILRVDWSKERSLACFVARKAAGVSASEEAFLISQRLGALERRKVARIEVLWSILSGMAGKSWREGMDKAAAMKTKARTGKEVKKTAEKAGEKVREEGGGKGGRALGPQEVEEVMGDVEEEEAESLGTILARYFEVDGEEAVDKVLEGGGESSPASKQFNTPLDRFVRADVISFCNSVETDNKLLTGRAVARIFHGISSPGFPSKIWYHNQNWQRYIHTDFDSIRSVADNVLASLRGEKSEQAHARRPTGSKPVGGLAGKAVMGGGKVGGESGVMEISGDAMAEEGRGEGGGVDGGVDEHGEKDDVQEDEVERAEEQEEGVGKEKEEEEGKKEEENVDEDMEVHVSEEACADGAANLMQQEQAGGHDDADDANAMID